MDATPVFPKPLPALAPNTYAYESTPLVKPTGFREYDARWLFEKEINLMGVQALGLGLGLPGLDGLVSGVISKAATPLDQILNGVLGTLGIGLGQADGWVSGVRCGGAVLVR